jgi:hypothetical protein
MGLFQAVIHFVSDAMECNAACRAVPSLSNLLDGAEINSCYEVPHNERWFRF